MAGPERLMADAEVPKLVVASSSGVIREIPTPLGSEARKEAERQQRRAEGARKFQQLGNETNIISNLEMQGPLSAEQQATLQQARERRDAIIQGATFEETINFIEQLTSYPSSAERDAVLREVREKRDQLLREANNFGLLNPLKEAMLDIYYGSRVKVSIKEREGRDEYAGRGTLERLVSLREIIRDPGIVEEDRTGRRMQLARDNKILLKEEEFWSSPELQRLEADLMRQNPGLKRGDLEDTYRGIADYFNRGSIEMIEAVVRDRKVSLDRFRDNGLSDIWNGINGIVEDGRGHVLTDENGDPRQAKNFDEVREAIEEERRMDPYISSRDYETWIQFVADDESELEEMIPYIAEKVIRQLGSGDANSLYESLNTEEKKIDKALAYFRFNSEAKRRRIRSTLTAEINGLGAYDFSKIARKDTGPYFLFTERLATACQDTERQDHLIDSSILDREGEVLAGLALYAGSLPDIPGMAASLEITEDEYQDLQNHLKDGGFWRYGRNTRTTHKDIDGKHDMGTLFRRQRLFRKRFEDILMNLKLKPMRELLNLDQEGKSLGDPVHPAFQRLKVRLDALDAQDKQDHDRNILDADGQPTTETRWEEYCKKALAWEDNNKIDDPRDRPRVIFQHPLARALRPKGFQDQQGTETQQSEFWSMFKLEEKDAQTNAKRRRLRQVIGRAKRVERILTAFQMDVTAGLTRHIVDDIREEGAKWHSNYGDVEVENNRPTFLKITPDLSLPIKFDNTEQKYVVEDIVPHFVLIRALSQQALKEDQAKAQKYGDGRRFFKWYHLLRNEAGIPIDSPQFAAWYEGCHDTNRPVLMQYTDRVQIFKDILRTADQRLNLPEDKRQLVDGRRDRDATDEKNIMTRWAENERQFLMALEYVVRKKFPKYFNFPGHDTDDGGGKDFRNANAPAYGISSDTVEITSFIQELLSPESDFGTDLGCTENPWVQLIGLWKGVDEVSFNEAGYAGYIANPRDPESWVKRAKGNFALMDLYNKGDKNQPGSFGVLNNGLLSGVYHLRTLDRDSSNFVGTQESQFGINKPITAYDLMQEGAYERYVETSARVIAPLMSVIYQIYNSADSNFGRNPGSAKFMATMYWYSLSSWMDREWAEYRGIYGYAYDAVLPLARVFMHTVLKESALIYTDTQWDEIMLGYSRVEYKDGSVERIIRYHTDPEGNATLIKYNEPKFNNLQHAAVKGATLEREEGPEGKTRKVQKTIAAVEVHEGILDAFPQKLRDEIIAINNDESQARKWLPMGVYSYRPETLKIMEKFDTLESSKRTQEIYKVVAEQLGQFTRPRTKVSRA